MPLSQLPGVSGDGSALVMDFMLILRRALGQQAPVKQALYRGIRAVLAIDSASTDAFLPLLCPRLQACMPQVCTQYYVQKPSKSDCFLPFKGHH